MQVYDTPLERARQSGGLQGFGVGPPGALNSLSLSGAMMGWTCLADGGEGSVFLLFLRCSGGFWLWSSVVTYVVSVDVLRWGW